MVKVLIHTDTRYPVNRKVIRKAVADTFEKHKISSLDAEVSVAVVGSRKMDELTQKYLGNGKRHEILTFPFEDISSSWELARGFVNPPDRILRLGDIVLCWPQVLEEAAREGVRVDDEIYFLMCHGVEHLLGQHHD